MIKSFEIVGAFHAPKGKRKATKCFPGLNEMVGKDHYVYANLKRKYTDIAMRKIKLQLNGYKVKGRVRLHYHFGEPLDGSYRDYGNISGGASKIIEDALQKAKVIENDSPKYLAPSKYTYIYTKDKPFIRVEIEEIGPLVEIKDIGQEE